MKKHEYRMYGLVPYQLSGIQKGIQFGHAVVEYSLQFGNTLEYKMWAGYDKTFIILNGGTTNKSIQALGTLNQHVQTLLKIDPNMNIAEFYEPDLGDQLTAITFLLDERVWDKDKYPDYGDSAYCIPLTIYGSGYSEWKSNFGDDADVIVGLRDFIRNLKLA